MRFDLVWIQSLVFYHQVKVNVNVLPIRNVLFVSFCLLQFHIVHLLSSLVSLFCQSFDVFKYIRLLLC